MVGDLPDVGGALVAHVGAVVRRLPLERGDGAPGERAAAGGMGLTYTRDMMTRRNNVLQFKFPGANGQYTLKVGYINDGGGKASYVVSVREPNSDE